MKNGKQKKLPDLLKGGRGETNFRPENLKKNCKLKFRINVGWAF